MPKSFINTNVATGQPVEASQVSQSYDAFTGTQDYAIIISGSLETQANSPVILGGDLILTDNISAISQSNFTASAGGGGFVALKYTENTKLVTSNTGITVTGTVNATAIDALAITSSDTVTAAGEITTPSLNATNITASIISASNFNIITLDVVDNLIVAGNTKLGNAETDRISITGSLAMEDPASGTANVSMSVKNDEFKLITNADATSIIGTPQLTLKNDDESETLAIFNADNDVQLFYNNTSRFATTNEGASISGSSVSTGLEVHDGTNTAIRSATQTRFNFAGNTYVSNESAVGAARVAFALGGTNAASTKVAVSSSNDLHVYSGSINVASGLTTPTGSYLSAGNLVNQTAVNGNSYQTARFFIKNIIVEGGLTTTNVFTYQPFNGLYPLASVSNAANAPNLAVTMKVKLHLMERGSTLTTPANKSGYLEFVGNFGIAADANTIAENTQGSIILVNQTSNILGSGTGDFAVSNNAGTDGSINIALDYASVTPTNGAQVGGEVEITIITQIA